MTAKTPPIPSENLSDKGPGEPAHMDAQQRDKVKPGVPDTAKQGQQGNTQINITPHLSVQDR